MRPIFLLTLVCATLGAAPPPNVVFILADDLGWTDIDSDWYETQNLDRLRREGMTFTQAYSPAANCAPSRASIITGQYVPRHGVYTVGSVYRFDRGMVGWGGSIMQGPNRDERTLLAPENARGIGTEGEIVGSLMQRAGYRTAYYGKWHVGWGGPIPINAYQEELRGFDEMILSGAQHYNPIIWPEPHPPIRPETYLSTYLADQAVRFISENRDQSFFLYYSDFLVHLPEAAPENLIAKYAAKPTLGRHKNPKYAAMIEYLDHSVGRILEALDAFHLTENTLVIFTSDNGGDPRTSNIPLRGSKGMFYEGGIRVPAIARWPGHIAPGSTNDTPISGIDLMPTLAELTGLDINDQPMDGLSLIPLFKGQLFRERNLFWFMPGYLPGRLPPSAVIRSGNWKLIHFFEDDQIELYDLSTDLGERNNLAKTHPAVAHRLKSKLDAWRDQIGAERPPRNPAPQVGNMIMGGGWKPKP
jgi:arylsulfatase A-like enzyme